MKEIPRQLAALLGAAVATAIVASIIQTHINLRELAALGAQVTAPLRARVTLGDLAGFAPVMAGIALAALLPAFGIGHLLLRYLAPGWRRAVFAMTAVAGLWVAFWLMLNVIPMPAIAATRAGADQAVMSLAGVAGGLLYAALSAPGGQAAQRRHGVTAAVLVAVPLALFFISAPAADKALTPVDPDSYQVRTLVTGLDRPWSVGFLPDGRLLVTEMGGRLLAITPAGKVSAIALDGLPPVFRQGGTVGLMDVAVDPDFTRNGWIYLTMGYGEAGANGTRLVRAELERESAKNMRVLFSSTPKPRAGNNGGRIAFLRDGTLALTIGDGNWRREEAQNPANHLGTVVRLDREGRPPADNPFTGLPGAAPEVYSLGHRNPQGIAVDPLNGDLLLTEHGARGGDEINRIVAGGNYGWPLITAGIDYPFARVTPFRRLEGFIDPLLEWTPSIAPSGLAVVSGPLFPGWRGDLLVPALRGRAVVRVQRDGRRMIGQQTLLANLARRMRDVKVGPDGAIYVLTDGANASLLRLSPP